MFFICTLETTSAQHTKQVFKALWPFKSFVTFVCPSSLLAVCTQTDYVEEAYFVYKDYSSRVMFLQNTRLSTLTIARSVPFALGWLFVTCAWKTMRKGTAGLYSGIDILIIDISTVPQAERPSWAWCTLYPTAHWDIQECCSLRWTDHHLTKDPELWPTFVSQWLLGHIGAVPS